jgi:uncharacterized protein YqjF (DUF2071 family)
MNIWVVSRNSTLPAASAAMERSGRPSAQKKEWASEIPVDPSRPLPLEEIAWQRLISAKGDPFVYADWENVVFLHYTIAPELVRPHVPAPLELELFKGKACLSVVAVTMRRFRSNRWNSPGWVFRAIGKQRFLNFRTYAMHGDEPGAVFLRGWLTRPMRLPLPSGMMGLPYTFASIEYQRDDTLGISSGEVLGPFGHGRFAYRARLAAHPKFKCCDAGSVSEFVMERYSGFFARKDEAYVFRAWHPPWLQFPIDVEVQDDSLIKKAFPWFVKASYVGASFAPGFKRVALGRAHRLPYGGSKHHRLSAFYEMP